MGKATRRAGAIRRYRHELNRQSRVAMFLAILGLGWLVVGLWALWKEGFRLGTPSFPAGVVLTGFGATLVVYSLVIFRWVRREVGRTEDEA